MSGWIRVLLLTLGLTAVSTGLSGLVGCADAPVAVENASTIPAPPVLLTASVDKAEVAVAEKVVYTVTLDHDPSIPVEMPDVFPKIQGFLVSDIHKEGPTSRDGRSRTTHSFTLQGLDAGSYILPALSVTYQDSKGESHTVGAPQLFVEVKSTPRSDPSDPNATPNPQASDDIEDIKPLEVPPPDYRRVTLMGAAIAGVLLLAGLAYWYWKRRNRKFIPPPPPPPPWDVALKALESLSNSELLAKGDGRAFSFQLSEIYRRYLEDRFRISAMEASTEELLAQFKTGSIPQGRLQDLCRRILLGTDQVKFAKQPLGKSDGEALLDLARCFVKETIPAPPEPAPESGKEGV